MPRCIPHWLILRRLLVSPRSPFAGQIEKIEILKAGFVSLSNLSEPRGQPKNDLHFFPFFPLSPLFPFWWPQSILVVSPSFCPLLQGPPGTRLPSSIAEKSHVVRRSTLAPFPLSPVPLFPCSSLAGSDEDEGISHHKSSVIEFANPAANNDLP